MTLIKDLLEISYNNGRNIVSFDITDMFSNVPINDLFAIIKLTCSQNNIGKGLSKTFEHLQNYNTKK
jgi:hypothetical protein